MTDNYFVITNSDGDICISQFTQSELMERIKNGDIEPESISNKKDPNYLGENEFILIKGEYVTLTPKQKTIEWIIE